jgi:hypothetical protein
MQKRKKVLILLGVFLLFLAGLATGFIISAKASYSISSVNLHDGLVSNGVAIHIDNLEFTLFTVNGDAVPDRVTLEYIGRSSKVLGTDIVMTQKSDNGVTFVKTKISNFTEPVIVNVKRK